MALTVGELLRMEDFKEVKILGGSAGLGNEISGITIIEAPDIVRFIKGGEALLTGLYAFKSSTIEEFDSYINELTTRHVSTIMLKRGRNVDNADMKIKMLFAFSEEHKIPLLDIPFDISFRDILVLIMERLFNEEVTQLKYFKTTYDIFAAMVLSNEDKDKKIHRIHHALENFIQNPAAVFDQRRHCAAYSADAPKELVIQEDAAEYEPGFFSSNHYLKQTNEYPQYVIQAKLNYREKFWVVITEKNQPFTIMDCIAAENAVTALRLEYSMQYAIIELEKKFQNDIMHNLLNGKIHSIEELQKNANLLDVPVDGWYRIVVIGMNGSQADGSNFKKTVKETELLTDVAGNIIKDCKVQNDLDKVVLIQRVDVDKPQSQYRDYLHGVIDEIQKEITKYDKHLVVKAGAGRAVNGIFNIPDSFREAKEAYMFTDIAGEISEDGDSKVTIFSDLGIFKLLCQLKDPDELMEYVPEGLQKLYEYKKPQRDDLILTLKTYLERNQNLSKTAQDLFVHYKTAAYRIEKISKITGFRFDNANEMLAVRIGLIVYQMIENHSNDTI